MNIKSWFVVLIVVLIVFFIGIAIYPDYFGYEKESVEELSVEQQLQEFCESSDVKVLSCIYNEENIIVQLKGDFEEVDTINFYFEKYENDRSNVMPNIANLIHDESGGLLEYVFLYFKTILLGPEVHNFKFSKDEIVFLNYVDVGEIFHELGFCGETNSSIKCVEDIQSVEELSGEIGSFSGSSSSGGGGGSSGGGGGSSGGDGESGSDSSGGDQCGEEDFGEAECEDGLDNDGDGFIDLYDSGCFDSCDSLEFAEEIESLPKNPTGFVVDCQSENSVLFSWNDNSLIETDFRLYSKNFEKWIQIHQVLSESDSALVSGGGVISCSEQEFGLRACKDEVCNPVFVTDIPLNYCVFEKIFEGEAVGEKFNFYLFGQRMLAFEHLSYLFSKPFHAANAPYYDIYHASYCNNPDLSYPIVELPVTNPPSTYISIYAMTHIYNAMGLENHMRVTIREIPGGIGMINQGQAVGNVINNAHEIGHALGLKHESDPHQYSGTITYPSFYFISAGNTMVGQRDIPTYLGIQFSIYYDSLFLNFYKPYWNFLITQGRATLHPGGDSDLVWIYSSSSYEDPGYCGDLVDCNDYLDIIARQYIWKRIGFQVANPLLQDNKIPELFLQPIGGMGNLELNEWENPDGTMKILVLINDYGRFGGSLEIYRNDVLFANDVVEVDVVCSGTQDVDFYTAEYTDEGGNVVQESNSISVRCVEPFFADSCDLLETEILNNWGLITDIADVNDDGVVNQIDLDDLEYYQEVLYWCNDHLQGTLCGDGNVDNLESCGEPGLSSCTEEYICIHCRCLPAFGTCGDWQVSSFNLDGQLEVCDDGNNENGDGCDSECRFE